MAGAKLLLLRDELKAGSLGQGLLDLGGAVADHHGDAGRLQGGGCPQHAFDDGQAGDPVQDLGQLGFHPRALAGGQDDDVNVTNGRGIQTLIMLKSGSDPKFTNSGV